MGTLSIASSGFTAPRPNGSRSTTISDADFDRLIAWARAKTAPAGSDARAAGQVLTDFIVSEFNAWKDAVEGFDQPSRPGKTTFTVT